MSRKKYLGGQLDQIAQTQTGRWTQYKVEIWNPNRTTVNDVVLDKARSPAYDITSHVRGVSYNENILWENNDDAVATHISMEIARDQNASPIPIDETTFLDSTPIRVWQGDKNVPQSEWIALFTGVLRGNPSTVEFRRDGRRADTFNVTAVDRAERYLNTVITARSYEKGTDVGRAAVETAIERMYLDRREVQIGHQDYAIGHESSQLVDIEVLKGIHQILFTTGKKPKFNGEGFLTAADTDLDKVPARRLGDKDLIIEIRRDPAGQSLYNAVRLLGLDDELTEILETSRRLAHGTITSGFFDAEVELEVFFSEDRGAETIGRRAKNTYGRFDVTSIGAVFGQNASWVPNLETDGYTTFSGFVKFDTGAQLEFRVVLLAVWMIAKLEHSNWLQAENMREAAFYERLATGTMMLMMLTLLELGLVEWEVHGEPFENVYQQLSATATVHGILTEDIKELELRNDWLYDMDWMKTRAKELLRRELIKGWTYSISMIDDPILEVDDVIEIDGRRYYITSIRKKLGRPGNAGMQITAWRLT